MSWPSRFETLGAQHAARQARLAWCYRVLAGKYRRRVNFAVAAVGVIAAVVGAQGFVAVFSETALPLGVRVVACLLNLAAACITAVAASTRLIENAAGARSAFLLLEELRDDHLIVLAGSVRPEPAAYMSLASSKLLRALESAPLIPAALQARAADIFPDDGVAVMPREEIYQRLSETV